MIGDAAVLATLSADHVVHARVEVRDYLGVWIDLTALGGVDWFDGARWRGGVDKFALSGTIDIGRFDADSGLSLEPLIEASAYNQGAGGAHDPLLRMGREVRLWWQATAPGGAPVVGAWLPGFHGIVQEVESTVDHVRLHFASMGVRLAQRRIKNDATFAFTAGPALRPSLEDVVQEVVDAEFGVGVFPVYVPAPTGVTVPKSIDVKAGTTVADVLARLGLESGGWVVRDKYDPATNAFRTTLYKPADKVTPDAVLAPSFYGEPENLRTQINDVVNVARAYYGGNGSFWQDEDAASIAKYEEVFQEIGKDGAVSSLDSLADAQVAVAALLADRAEPVAAHRVPMSRFFGMVEVGDLYTWQPNGYAYDTAHDWAVVEYEHSLAPDENETVILTRGTPAAAGDLWGSLFPTPDAELFLAGYQGQNLLAQHPTFNPSRVYASGENADVLVSFIARMLPPAPSYISARVFITPDTLTDKWRAGLWFTDAAGVTIAGPFPGDLVTGTTGESTSAVHAIAVPPGAYRIHVGIVGDAANTGDATFDRPQLNIGRTAGVYAEPPAATQAAQVMLRNPRTLGEVDDPLRESTGILHVWDPAPGIAEIHVFDGAAWPAASATPDVILPGDATEYRVLWPAAAGTRFLEVRAIDADGNVVDSFQAEVKRDPDAPEAPPQIAAYLRAIADYNTSKIDVELRIDGALFPVDVVIREGSQIGTAVTIASFQVAAPDTITKVDVAALGQRIFGGNPFGWWAELTDAVGTVVTLRTEAPGINAFLISVSHLAEIADDAGVIVHGVLQNVTASTVLDLDATGNGAVLSSPNFSIHANGVALANTLYLNEVVIGAMGGSPVIANTGTRVTGGGGGLGVSFDPWGGFLSAVTHGSFTGSDKVFFQAAQDSRSGSTGAMVTPAVIGLYASGGEVVFEVSQSPSGGDASVTFGGKSLVFGAPDSAGSGLRTVSIPN